MLLNCEIIRDGLRVVQVLRGGEERLFQPPSASEQPITAEESRGGHPDGVIQNTPHLPHGPHSVSLIHPPGEEKGYLVG